MIFKSLKIEQPLYGADKNKLVAEIVIGTDKVTTKLVLPDEVGLKILQLSKEALIDAVEKTANEFIFDLTTSIPESLNLENT